MPATNRVDPKGVLTCPNCKVPMALEGHYDVFKCKACKHITEPLPLPFPWYEYEDR